MQERDTSDATLPSQPGPVPKKSNKALSCGCLGAVALFAAIVIGLIHLGDSSPDLCPAGQTTAAASPSSRDIPALDLTGSGDACVMTYGPTPTGGTLTEFGRSVVY